MRHPHRPVLPGHVDHREDHDQAHSHTHVHAHRPVARQRLFISMVLTGSMMVVELVGGIIVNSLALVSDAGHMFTHCFALSLSFFAILIAARPAPNKHTFGFYRIEILAAFTNGLMLLGVTVYILYEMVVRFLNPEPIAAIQMLVIAILGLVVNLASVLLLTGVGKDDLNVKSAFLHMIGDTLSSVAVVAGAVVIHFTGWWQVDPVLSGLIAVMIGIWAFRLLRDSANILLESTPKHLSISQVEEELRAEFPEIENLHDVHVWEITSGMYAMTAHVTVGSHTTVNRVRGVRVRMEAFVRERFRVAHTAFQFEDEDACCGGKLTDGSCCTTAAAHH